MPADCPAQRVRAPPGARPGIRSGEARARYGAARLRIPGLLARVGPPLRSAPIRRLARSRLKPLRLNHFLLISCTENRDYMIIAQINETFFPDQLTEEVTRIIGPSECGRDRPGFGWQAVSLKLPAIQYKRVLNIINLKLYNVL